MTIKKTFLLSITIFGINNTVAMQHNLKKFQKETPDTLVFLENQMGGEIYPTVTYPTVDVKFLGRAKHIQCVDDEVELALSKKRFISCSFSNKSKAIVINGIDEMSCRRAQDLIIEAQKFIINDCYKKPMPQEIPRHYNINDNQ